MWARLGVRPNFRLCSDLSKKGNTHTKVGNLAGEVDAVDENVAVGDLLCDGSQYFCSRSGES